MTLSTIIKVFQRKVPESEVEPSPLSLIPASSIPVVTAICRKELKFVKDISFIVHAY